MKAYFYQVRWYNLRIKDNPDDCEFDVMVILAENKKQADKEIEEKSVKRYNEFWQGNDESYKQWGYPKECIDFVFLGMSESGDSVPFEIKE